MYWLAAALALKAATHVAVQLPQFLPYVDVHRTYAIVEEKRASYYSVDFAAVPDCNGAHVCSYAHAIGSRTPLPIGYRPFRISAYCTDAALAWRQDGYYYELDLKCGTLAELHAMRRSMRRY
ncbi:MAG: hypothetical protein ABR508_00395 [Candidatus Baltobacteraceae bacterium]